MLWSIPSRSMKAVISARPNALLEIAHHEWAITSHLLASLSMTSREAPT